MTTATISGAELNAALLASGCSTKNLADRMYVGRPAVNHWVRNQVPGYLAEDVRRVLGPWLGKHDQADFAMTIEQLDAALDTAGMGASDLSRRLGFTRQTISHWRAAGRVPPKRVAAVRGALAEHRS